MFYIKFTIVLFFAFFIYGCAQQTQPDEQTENQNQSRQNVTQEDISTSDSEFARYKLAISYLFNDDLDKAQSILHEFTEQRPELAGPWANLGLIKLKQNDYVAAETLINKALDKNPELPQALNLMGNIKLHNGEVLDAERLYKHSIALKPDYYLAHYNLALLYDIYLQNIPKAIVHYKAYLKLIKEDDTQTRNWLEQLEAYRIKG